MLARVESVLDELRAVTDGLAHDLRSPLTRLKARIDKLQQGSVIDAADLEAVSAEAESLLGMLDTSLEITRAEAGIGLGRLPLPGRLQSQGGAQVRAETVIGPGFEQGIGC